MLIKTNRRPPTPYYPFLDYQWTLDKKRGQAVDVSEWEITCKETRPHEGKRKSDTGKATQLPVSETLSQVVRLRKKRKKKLRLTRKD
jgi:hypothetical protein